MNHRLRTLTTFLFAVAVIAFSPSAAEPQNSGQDPFSSVEDFQREFQSVPCRTKDRLPAVRSLFEKMGAKPNDFISQKQGNVENLQVRLPGLGAETIIIGAHYDFIDAGCGAVDNWTGIVALAHVYHTMGKFSHRKNVLFVAFDHEEDGLNGSRMMAKAIKKAEIPQYCGMINIDSFGLAGPFALASSSSPSLVRLSEATAEALKVPFYKVSLGNADADSSSFVARDIPAVTLSGLSKDWDSILHSRNDQTDKIQPISVYLGYRLALSLFARMDEAPCNEFAPRK